MDAGTPLNQGDIVQVKPGNGLDVCYATALFIVDEPKVFGAQVYAVIPQERGTSPSLLFLRVKWEDMELVGKARFAFINTSEVNEGPEPLPDPHEP